MLFGNYLADFELNRVVHHITNYIIGFNPPLQANLSTNRNSGCNDVAGSRTRENGLWFETWMIADICDGSRSCSSPQLGQIDENRGGVFMIPESLRA